MVKRASLIICCIILSFSVKAQQGRPLTVALFSNATTLPTQPSEIFRSVHPGILVGTAFRYNKSPKNQLVQTLKLGYIYHQFVQHSVQLYSEFEYKRMLGNRINLATALGIGYVHIFTATQVFERNEEGQYEKKTNWGRPQVMGSFALGAGYTIKPNSDKPIEVFTRYQFVVQTPFVRQYVPVLPSTALHLGLNYPVFKRNK